MLAIDPDYQGKGLAKKQIERAENLVRENGSNTMEMSIVHVRPNLANFYGKFGYSQVGTAPWQAVGTYGTLKVPFIEMLIFQKSL